MKSQTTPQHAVKMGISRQEYVASLRARYTAGTLSEILVSHAKIPDSLMTSLFPHMFPRVQASG
jgi:hypothetical protein